MITLFAILLSILISKLCVYVGCKFAYNLEIVRIHLKVILDEIIKIDGRRAEYSCWLHEGRYQCIIHTVISTKEENMSGRLVQIIGLMANTKVDPKDDNHRFSYSGKN